MSELRLSHSVFNLFKVSFNPSKIYKCLGLFHILLDKSLS